jgi:dihydroflavonol-4-reductase
MLRACTLVTGATGFVGSRLVRHLLGQGERVKALVRPGANLRSLAGLTEVELAYGDVTVVSSVYRALAGCTRVYHLATNHRWWDSNPARILGPAIDGTRAVLAAARRRGVEKIVVTGSITSLGVAQRPEPMDEAHWLVEDRAELYALAKYRAELLALKQAEQGLPVVIVEPAFAVGPGDWRPTPSGELVLRYLKSRWRIPVYPGGLNVVDVDDVCAGHWLAMQRGRPGERYILGGDNLTFAAFWSLLWEITGHLPPGRELGRGMLGILGGMSQLGSYATGAEPWCTLRRATHELVGYSWASSAKAEAELGYTHRSARAALERSVRFLAGHRSVPEDRAARLRHELGQVA